MKGLIQEVQNSTNSRDSTALEKSIQLELDELLLREELLWKDKAKAKWNEQGDSNTHFFHLTTIIHRNQNHISRLLNDQSEWLDSRVDIGNSFVSYFTTIFTSSHPRIPPDLLSLIPPLITPADNLCMEQLPMPHEFGEPCLIWVPSRVPGLTA